MTSMDIETLPSEYSGHDEHSNADSKKKSNRISARRDSGTIADAIKDAMRIPSARNVSFISCLSYFHFFYVRRKLHSCMSNSMGQAILSALITSILMVIGILTVYYASPKPTGMFFLGYLYI